MQVSEEIDALRAMGFDPVRWLVVPRCLALVIVLPLLTWIGDGLALVGGLAATTVITHMTPRAYAAGDGRHNHPRQLAGRTRQEPVSRPGDRPHRLRSRACRAGRRRRGRRADDERGRPGHLRHDRHQLALHAPLRVPRHMTEPHPRPHIIVDDLRIGWGSRFLMEHVSFDIARGSTFAILGGSGCGKSSLLRHLIGLGRPQAGRIDIDGVGEPHLYEGTPPFGVLFQSGALFSSLTLAGEPGAADEDVDVDSR